MRRGIPTIGRRDLLGLALTTFVSAVPWIPASAEVASDAGATAPVQRLDDALLVVMKAGQNAPFAQRFATLAPVIEQTLDLESVLAASIGLSWAAMTSDRKTQLLTAFRRYTVASYAANFDSYSGQNFQISPIVRRMANDDVIVQTKITSADGSATRLDYVMRKGVAGWRAVDVLADGSISRVAVQRSDFRRLLQAGGTPALMVGLLRKVATLSGGMIA